VGAIAASRRKPTMTLGMAIVGRIFRRRERSGGAVITEGFVACRVCVIAAFQGAGAQKKSVD
jgi:hypothetical protein